MITILTILAGLALSGGGLYGYFGTGMASLTALLPAIPGILILVCGLVALKRSKASSWLMGAQIISFATLIISIPNALQITEALDGTAIRPVAIWLSVGFVAITAAYLLVAVPSAMLIRPKVTARAETRAVAL